MNSEQYKAANYIKNTPNVTRSNLPIWIKSELLDSLFEEKYIQYDENAIPFETTGDWAEISRDYANAHLIVTQIGYTAFEEYESSHRSEIRENESLSVMKEDLKLHQEEIKSMKIWNIVNSTISIISVVIAFFSLVVAFLALTT